MKKELRIGLLVFVGLILIIGIVNAAYIKEFYEDFAGGNYDNTKIITRTYGTSKIEITDERINEDYEAKLFVSSSSGIGWKDRADLVVLEGEPLTNTYFAGDIFWNGRSGHQALAGIDFILDNGNGRYYTPGLGITYYKPISTGSEDCLMFKLDEWTTKTKRKTDYYFLKHSGETGLVLDYAGYLEFYEGGSIISSDFKNIPSGAICADKGIPFSNTYRILMNYRENDHSVTAFIQEIDANNNVVRETSTSETFLIPQEYNQKLWAKAFFGANEATGNVFIDNLELKYGEYTPIIPSIPEERCSSDSQRIFRISSESNAHGELWDGTGNYPQEICYDTIFGEAYSETNPHACVASNTVLKLSDSTNAHAGDKSSSYGTDVCYGELLCQSYNGNSCSDLGQDYKCVATISSANNAHLATCDSSNAYQTKICCNKTGGGIPQEPGTCDLTSASWQVDKISEEELVNLIVEGDNCQNANLIFKIAETDCLLNCDYTNIDETDTAQLENNEFEGIFGEVNAWLTEWIEDTGNGIGDSDPEYIFRVALKNDENEFEDSGKLKVIRKCGNGQWDVGEDCDGGDNCQSNCQCELGYKPTDPRSTNCERTPSTCLNGVLDSGEECDGGEGCLDNCVCGEGYVSTEPKSTGCQQIVQGCEQFSETECNNHADIATAQIRELRDDGLTCTDDIPLDDYVFDNPDCTKARLNNCQCVWDNNDNLCKAQNEIQEYECRGTIPDPNPRGTCTYSQELINLCDDKGVKNLTVWGNWNWLSPSSAQPANFSPKVQCETKRSQFLPCPTITRLPFFGFWNLVVALIGIMVVYGYLISKEKK